MRTNPEDVRLATLASDVNATTNTIAPDSTSDQWKDLTGPQVDPMVIPSPLKTPLPPASANGPKTKPIPSKDDYGPQVGWGLRAAVGPAIQQSVSARSGGGEVYQTLNFSPGFRSDMELFYNVTNGFYFGLESGLIYNTVSSVSSSALPNINLTEGSDNFGNGSFYQVPVLANLRFQIPNSGKFRGYCTGGAGPVWDYLTISAAGATFTQHQWNLSFQLGCGFQYNLLPGLDLDTSFKTFITPNPLIFSDGTSQVKASYNYALEIGLAYRF